jgi:preprotein translocase subunit SecD
MEGMIEPGPYDGDRDEEVTLVSDDRMADGEDDARLILIRLNELGVDAELIAAGRRTIRIAVEDVRDGRAALGAVTPMRRLELRLIAEDQGALAGAVGPNEDSLVPVLSTLSPAERGRVGIECEQPYDPGASAECRPYFLEEVIVDGRNVVDATVAINEWDRQPVVSLQFDEEGGRRFGDVTAASVQRKLAIVLDGRIQSAPVINSAIYGGRAQITMGSSVDHVTPLREANQLVAALRSGVLSTSWRVAEVRPR